MQRPPVVGALLADPKRIRRPGADARFEPRAAFAQWQAANVVVGIAQQIERDDRDRLRLVDLFDLPGSGQMNASLKTLKSSGTSLLVESDDFRINEQRALEGGTKRLQRADDGWELRRLVVAKP